MPWFVFAESSSLKEMNWMCTQASAGDVVMLWLAYLTAVWLNRQPGWIQNEPFGLAFLLFILVAQALNFVMEGINRYWLDRWQYAETMWVIPALDLGVFPVLQWFLIPSLLVLLIHKMLTPPATTIERD